MKPFIYMPVKVFFGKDCMKTESGIFDRMGKSCLIVTGAHSGRKSGALDDLENIFHEKNIKYHIFDEITPNPPASDCIRGAAFARSIDADFIVGVGGGSALDAAKAVAICAANPGYDVEGLYKRQIPSKKLPLILVGTTCGTGSEVTGVSVLTDETGHKRSISGEDCYGDVAFCDSSYIYSLSRESVVSTSLDALAHLTESWFSPFADGYIRAIGKEAISLMDEALSYLYDTREEGASVSEAVIDKLYTASIYAGLMLNRCGAGFPHTMGYALTEKFGVPHGKACTFFYGEYLKRAEKYGEFFDEFRESFSDFEKFLSCVEALTNVKKLSASEEEIKNWVSRWEGNKNFLNTPGGFTTEDAEKVLKQLMNNI